VPAPARRSFIPVLEHLEDRNLLSDAAPGALVLQPQGILPASGGSLPPGFSPAQIRHAYGFDQITFENGSAAGNGSGQTIAIIDAYDQPNIASNLATFDATYGIAAPPSFTKVNEFGGVTPPAASASWGLEISLDVEWAHAIAPGANILLVEANSSSWSDLLTAVNFARNVPGVSVVSMSFGGSEWSGETAFDPYFTTPAGHAGVSFVASTGDSGSAAAPEVPSVSPNVLAVGGTQLFTDGAGDYLGEVGWSGSGGGVSVYEPQPAYQAGVVTQTATRRAVPDVAYDGSPNSPFAVYDTTYYSGWIEVYGTSCGAPQWSALVAIADQGRALDGLSSLDGPTQLLPAIYALPGGDFHDVASGSNGAYSAGPGYDLVTGRGSPLANTVVAALAGPTISPGKPTFTSVAGNVNPSTYGQSVIFTAEVFASDDGTPTGTVTFLANGVVLGQGTLNHGTAAFASASLAPGGYSITAVYSGDSSYQGGSSYPLFQLVSATDTTVDLSSSANPAVVGQGITFSAAVAPVAPGRGVPTGLVYFLLGGSTVGVAALVNGTASYSAAPGAGTVGVVAIYTGDGHFRASSSSTLTQVVNPAPGGQGSSGSSAGSSGPARDPEGTTGTAADGASAGSADPAPAAAGIDAAERNGVLAALNPPANGGTSQADVTAGRAADPSRTAVQADLLARVDALFSSGSWPAATDQLPDDVPSALSPWPAGSSGAPGDTFAAFASSEFENATSGWWVPDLIPRR
jgi:subtilase family serine protease